MNRAPRSRPARRATTSATVTGSTSTVTSSARGNATRARTRVVGLVGLVGASAAVLLCRSLLRTRDLREAVAPELRHPVLFVPIQVAGSRSLAVGRRALIRRPRPVAGVAVTDRSVTVTTPPEERRRPPRPALRVRSYERPDRAPRTGALLWIHGGGLIMGTPEQDDHWLSWLADELGILAVSVDYRLAPEHPYPAGLDDCMDALRWLHESADELGVDRARIAVGGASAGGGLAASVALRARDEGGPPLCLQLLNYPMLDDRTVLRDDHAGTGAFVWTPTSNRFAWTAYLGGQPRHDDDRTHAAPARATDLADLPPAWIGVGDLDLFHAEDVDYAHRLDGHGVPCELVVEPGMYHGADAIAVSAPRMQAYRESMLEALRRTLT